MPPLIENDTYFATLPEKQTEQAKLVSPSSVGLERKKEGYVWAIQ